MAIMSDHQENVHRTYDRSWDEIEVMLDRAERKLNYHLLHMDIVKPKSKKWVEHARNFKALQGVIKTLRWTLGEKGVIDPLE